MINPMNFEFAILDFIQNHLRSDVGDMVMSSITRLGDAGIFWILMTAVLLLYPKTRLLGAAAAAALVTDLVCCNLILKPLVARTRPYEINTAIELLVSKPTDYSFPSGHTAASFAVVLALYFMKAKRLWIPSLILAILIACSRLYLYVHFPTDVLGGVLVGIFAGYVGYRFAGMKRVRMRLTKNEDHKE